MQDLIKPLALGLLVFVIIIAGGTYLLQDFRSWEILQGFFPQMRKLHAIYFHWAMILIVLPFIAGTLVKLLQAPITWLVIVLGTAISAVILYPQYSGYFWAEAPKVSYIITYCVMVMGMGYFATQPLKATFVTALRVFQRNEGSKRPRSAPKKPAPSANLRNRMSDTQRVSSRRHGDLVALIELLVGVVSLALSIFSIFVLGQGG